jgi:adenosylcobinamide-phosphate synthase
VAFTLTNALAPAASVLALAVVLDLALGDPVYRGHPVRLIGDTLQRLESALWRAGANGYGGGVLLFVALSVVWVGGVSVIVMRAAAFSPRLAWALHAFLLYSLLAMGDLLHHGWRIERALRRGDLPAARRAVSQLVGRDTDRMNAGACRRAAVESLGENLTDGFVSPLCWYVVAGLPGVVLFKVVSTMDSMVGYKTPRYLRFGWCGARLDDLMNLVPARLTFVLLSMTASVLPGYSGRKAAGVGLEQHGLLPGPNSGWSEAAVAGALQRRLVGPIWVHGQTVTDAWLGDPSDPPLETADDYRRASILVALNGMVAAMLAWITLAHGVRP